MRHDTNIADQIGALPHAQFLDKARIRLFSKHIQTNCDHPPEFYINRLAYVGGSEVGSIVAHYTKASLVSSIESDLFKDAHAISREKLLYDMPLTTPQAERGSRIEGFIRELFERKFPTLRRDYKAIEASKKPLGVCRGSIDDAYISHKQVKILVDYKSTVSDSEAERFSNIAQLNFYNKIVEHHEGQGFDKSVIAKLIADEKTFDELINVYENREEEPDIYEFYLNRIISGKMKNATFNVNEVKLDLEYGKLCVDIATKFAHETFLKGKTLKGTVQLTELNEEENQIAKELESRAHQINSIIEAATAIKNKISEQINAFQKDINGRFKWPEAFPVKVEVKEEFDMDAAYEFLKESGVDTNGLYSATKTLDAQKVKEYVNQLGGELDDSFYEMKLSKSKIISATERVGVDIGAFIKSEKVGFQNSRKRDAEDQKAAAMLEWSEKIYRELLAVSKEESMNVGGEKIKNSLNFI